jgi:hypothetical protein
LSSLPVVADRHSIPTVRCFCGGDTLLLNDRYPLDDGSSAPAVTGRQVIRKGF